MIDVPPVSIPMTVLGGLQFHGYLISFLFSSVSIPMTVLGGLQFMEVAHDNIYYEKFQYR